MEPAELSKILAQHALWATGQGGTRANLASADLRRADLRRANLSGASLSGANLSGANLSGASLSGANLSGADLSRADLRSADLRSADLRSAGLSDALLRDANLSRADLRSADLRSAGLSDALLRDANLSGALLRDANLSGATGVATAAEFLRTNFKTNNRGCLLAYKAIGNTCYGGPLHWEIAPGKYLTETVNPDRGTECACGVNVATLAYLGRHHRLAREWWLVGIEPADLADVVVPFGTDGKFRAARVRLIRRLTDEERAAPK